MFVVLSGLPVSGKTTLAHRLAPRLGLPALDKDAILESLYDANGVGDEGWRRALSRESDRILQAQASTLDGAILVSHWRLDGMPPDSGTPIGWLFELSAPVVNIRCECRAGIGAERYIRRQRHPGHLDQGRTPEDIHSSIETLASLGHPAIPTFLSVDTTRAPELDTVIQRLTTYSEPCT